ncbi:MAG: hypothetical protein H6623_04285 [Bdellovibrionaceae bacterium]|nr:hypothetical protein [Pseudobdellovibrionaceae bacterium]
MKHFTYSGELSSSKSLYNRALIAQSFSEQLQVKGSSQSEDVLHLQRSLRAFKAGEEDFFCGDGGTTFRFLAVRVSRKPGVYKLSGSIQLFSRPMQDLFDFFTQMQVCWELQGQTLVIKSSGWAIPPDVRCLSKESSQFLSAILLSSWDLETDLHLSLPDAVPSQAYFAMTMEFVKSLGLKIQIQGNNLLVLGKQKIKAQTFVLEPDMSSLFALSVCAIFDGEVTVYGVPQESIQPDRAFLDIFKKMGIEYQLAENSFHIKKQAGFVGIDIDLSSTPDLFPVLCVLLAQAKGKSLLTGLETLKYKESDRYSETLKLLHILGVVYETWPNTISITGQARPFRVSGEFSPCGDHRMAMAAQAANCAGASLQILEKNVVKKSFPEFWEIITGEMSC